MTIPLRIERLEWDDWNREHITKHGIAREDIEAAIKSVLLVKPSYKERFVIFGTTPAGRIITVVVGEVPGKPDVYYVFSARPANRRERRGLEQERES